MDKKLTCSTCKAELNNKEQLSAKLYGIYVCDVCMGKKRLIEMSMERYKKRLADVPQLYREDKFDDSIIQNINGKSIVLVGRDYPLIGTRFLWDVVKYYWKNGNPGEYVSIKSAHLEYSSCQWQQRNDMLERLANTNGILAIDNVDNSTYKDMLSFIIERRSEHGMVTIISIHMDDDNIGLVMNEKAEQLIRGHWKIMGLDPNEK